MKCSRVSVIHSNYIKKMLSIPIYGEHSPPFWDAFKTCGRLSDFNGQLLDLLVLDSEASTVVSNPGRLEKILMAWKCPKKVTIWGTLRHSKSKRNGCNTRKKGHPNRNHRSLLNMSDWINKKMNLFPWLGSMDLSNQFKPSNPWQLLVTFAITYPTHIKSTHPLAYLPLRSAPKKGVRQKTKKKNATPGDASGRIPASFKAASR